MSPILKKKKLRAVSFRFVNERIVAITLHPMITPISASSIQSYQARPLSSMILLYLNHVKIIVAIVTNGPAKGTDSCYSFVVFLVCYVRFEFP
jgi:hypothetical protein